MSHTPLRSAGNTPGKFPRVSADSNRRITAGNRKEQEKINVYFTTISHIQKICVICVIKHNGIIIGNI